MTDEELEALAETLDLAVERLSLEEAIDVMEYLQEHVRGVLGGLYEDRRHG